MKRTHLLFALLASGCSGDAGTADATGGTGGTSGTTGEVLEGYDSPDLWLCHPDKPVTWDQCLANDLTATEILPDGSRQQVDHIVASDPAFDCFYVYPTVDIRLVPGQTEDFDDISQELDPLLSQAARFSSMCRVFAPLYHQVTFGTLGSSMQETLLDAAYVDVLAAFESYLERHGGERDFVIIGHSQGTRMTTTLVQEVIEPNPDLATRMIAALVIGGGISVPPDEQVGGTFPTIPLCASADAGSCIVAYRTYAADLPPEPGAQSPDIPGNDVACTNPGDLSGARSLLGGAYLPTSVNQPGVFPEIDFGETFDTPFVLYRDLYAAECLTDSDGLGFLAISVEPGVGDVRLNPIEFDAPLLSPGFLGLHVLDFNFAMQDLLDLVATKAAARGL